MGCKINNSGLAQHMHPFLLLLLISTTESAGERQRCMFSPELSLILSFPPGKATHTHTSVIRRNQKQSSWVCRSRSGRSFTSPCHPAICNQSVSRWYRWIRRTRTLIIHLSAALALKRKKTLRQPLKNVAISILSLSSHSSVSSRHPQPPVLCMECMCCQAARRWLLAKGEEEEEETRGSSIYA